MTTLEALPDDAEKAILLYPDSICLGWWKIENNLKQKSIELWVINGRKRSFIFDNTTKKGLYLRRFLEITFLPEIIVSPFIIIYGAILSLKDKLLGRS